MWSHEIDDGSNGSGDGDSLVPQNVACPKCERASGFWDARNVFNANAVYQLPFGPGKPFLNQPGLVNAIVGRWQFTSTAGRAHGIPGKRSGQSLGFANARRQHRTISVPISYQEFRSPHRGAQPSANGSTPLPSSAPANGTWGDSPRDVARGPGVWQIDMGMGKEFPLTERVGLQFRTEVFNIFNHPQYGLPNATILVSGFGSITNTVNTTTPVSPVGEGTPRQFQFALRAAVLKRKGWRSSKTRNTGFANEKNVSRSAVSWAMAPSGICLSPK